MFSGARKTILECASGEFVMGMLCKGTYEYTENDQKIKLVGNIANN